MALGRASPAEPADPERLGANRLAHSTDPAEEAAELTWVRPQAFELAVDQVGDIDVLGRQRDARRQAGEDLRIELVGPLEPDVQRLREVLVEAGSAPERRACLREQRHRGATGLAVVYVASHPQRQVQAIRPQPGKGAPQFLHGRRVIRTRRAISCESPP